MINKNDPLVVAVQKVMQNNQAERDAVKTVNEKFGVTSRNALPRERQADWDIAYKSVLTEGVEALDEDSSLAAETPPYKKVTKKDVLFRRGVLKKHPTQPGKHVLAKEQTAPKTDPYAEGQASSISTVAQPKKEVTPADQSDLTKKIKSVLKEKITKSTPAGKVISDFVHSDNPKFAGKSKEERTKMALGAYYSKHPEKSKKVDEGFNNRHDLSVNASVEEQVVAELNEAGGINPRKIEQEKSARRSRAVLRSRAGTGDFIPAPVNTKKQDADLNAMEVANRDVRDNNVVNRPNGMTGMTGNGSLRPRLDRPNGMTGMTGNGSLRPRLDRPNGMTGNGSLRPRLDRPNGMTGNGSLRPRLDRPAVSTVGRDRPGTGPGQGPGAPTGPENIKMATQKAADTFKFTDKEKAGKVSKERLAQFYKEKGLKASGKSSQDLRTFMNAAKNKTLNTKVTPATELQKANQARLQTGKTSTTSSVQGGQGVAALPSGPARPAASSAPIPKARPSDVGSTGPARPTMASNAKEAGQMAVDRMIARKRAETQTSAMSGGGTMGTDRARQAQDAAKRANMSGGGVNKPAPDNNNLTRGVGVGVNKTAPTAPDNNNLTRRVGVSSTGTIQGVAPQTDTAKDLQNPVNQQSMKTLNLTAASRSLDKGNAVKEIERRQNIQTAKGA